MKIALYGKKIETKDVSKIQELFDLLKEEKVQFVVHKQLKLSVEKHDLIKFGWNNYFESYDDLKNSGVSFMISIGGDGTFLNTILLVRDLKIPILGINTGRLGFLSNTPTSEIKSALNDVISENYSTQERSLLRLESNKNHFGNDNHALNEISILKSDSSSMITIHTELNGTHLNSYWTDGLIISTATGSTAYSLSCGGPIMMPGSGNFVITPIAPHNLNVRPIVIDDDAILKIVVESRAEKNLVTMDSRSEEMKNGEVLTIQKADYKISIVQLQNQSFVNSLRNKLNWGLDQRNS
ncbi:NAD kinase [Vicingaceae bacterium]|nr:NAD kinase [Vicingaceae bacterium]MDC0004788.1 NAD kinase [bacterium]MDC1450830.1 NAD kinase [Vicingaceae bacterium]